VIAVIASQNTEGNYMRKLFIITAAIAALAIPTAAMASVAVDASGNGFVGKGDVQTALGYANDTAFQAANPASATFTIDGDRIEFSTDVVCETADGSTRVVTVDNGYLGLNEVVIKSEPKMSNGKVTGYNLKGSVTEYANHTNPVNLTLVCGAGEHFAVYADTTPNGRWRSTPVQGTGVLQVTLAGNHAALPNTPVPAPVV
jgi:hypothetical protein